MLYASLVLGTPFLKKILEEIVKQNKKIRGFNPQAKFTYRTIAAGRRS
jgi:hypothetical protein